MTHKTKGIVLRTVKYGETSLVVTIFTELFGIQTYIVNGVRTSKQSSARANHFQPAVILDMEVYHHGQKSMQRIKEFRFAYLYRHVLNDVVKNSIALFMVELLGKCLKQPEENAALFSFCEDAFTELDTASKTVTANFALFFSLHVCHFFGMRMSDTYSNEFCFLDLQEGVFIDQPPGHPNFLEKDLAQLTSQLLKVMQPKELELFKLNQEIRRALLLQYQNYFSLHIQDFGQMKTLRILSEVL